MLEDTDSLAKVLGETGYKCAKVYPFYGLPLRELNRLEAKVIKLAHGCCPRMLPTDATNG